MRVLFWNRADPRKEFAGKQFEVFAVRWDKGSRQWAVVPDGNHNYRSGIIHPVSGEIIALRKRNLSYYGVVIEVTPVPKPSIDIETEVVMGTPGLGVVEDEEEE